MKPIFSGMLQNSQHLRSRILNNHFTFAYEKINVSVFVFFSGQGNCFIVYAGGMHVAHGYTNTVQNSWQTV